MTVLITGANGRTSRQVIHTILSTPNCPPLRILVHSQASLAKLGSTFPQLLASPHKIIVADYLKPDTLPPAFDGVSVVFHNGPAFHPSEASMGIAVIDAAMESGSNPHIVFCSILHPMRSKIIDNKAKLTIEEYLTESKLHYTILQPTYYMQNISLTSVYETGVLPLGCSPSVPQGFLDLIDLAEVARIVITSPLVHNCASYELVGQNLPYSSVAKIIQEETGKPIECTVLPVNKFVQKNGLAGVASEYSQDAAERLIFYFDRWGLTGNQNIVRWLLGREPTSWNQCIRRELTTSTVCFN